MELGRGLTTRQGIAFHVVNYSIVRACSDNIKSLPDEDSSGEDSIFRGTAISEAIFILLEGVFTFTHST